MKKFFDGFEKKAGVGTHIAEVAGLGALAVPSLKHLTGKKLPEDTVHKLELAGLGTLALPSIKALITKKY